MRAAHIEDRGKKTNRIRLWVIAVWLMIWQLVAMKVNSTILLASPVKVLMALWNMLFTGEFYTSVCNSLVRITLGFCLAVLFGITLAALSYRFRRVRELMQLPVSVIKATPVASFIIIVLIWVPARNISVVIAFLMAFPVIYTNVLHGLLSQDRRLLEMGRVFRLSWGRSVRYIHVPQVIPYMRAACETALAMSWKAGIAAEVIGLARGSIGEHLYQAKIYLETPELLAWTVVIVIVSFAFERLFMFLIELGFRGFEGRGTASASLKKMYQTEPSLKYSPAAETGKIVTASDVSEADSGLVGDCIVTLEDVTKAFGDKQVLKGMNLSFRPGTITCIQGKSGVGKTTLLNLILGLERPDAGVIKVQIDGNEGPMSAVFQENRLCENLTAWMNVRMVLGNGKAVTMEEYARACHMLERVGLDPQDTRPVSEYSGGMQRRVAIVRALATNSSMLIMDEPLTGLDEETRGDVIELIREAAEGRTVIIVTHDPRDAEEFNADVINMS